jgi:hypothetical protein
MDPWLERPSLWSGIHTRLITYIADGLQPLLGRRYAAAVEERVYVSSVGRSLVPDVSVRRQATSRKGGTPTKSALLEADEAIELEVADEEVREAYIRILDLETKQQVVTVIEVLSPGNKKRGAGRTSYLSKQREVMHSKANFVEIDLLRSGRHVLALPEERVADLGVYDYLVSVCRKEVRSKRFTLYPRTVRQRLPRIATPLRSGDSDVTLDLQVVVDRLYEAGVYEDRLDYSKPCIPRLRPDDEAWARERIAQWQAARQA